MYLRMQYALARALVGNCLYCFSSENKTEVRLCLSSLGSVYPAVLLDLTTASCLSAVFSNCKLVLPKEQTGKPPKSRTWLHCPDSLGACTRLHPQWCLGPKWSLSNKPRKSKVPVSGTEGLTYLRHEHQENYCTWKCSLSSFCSSVQQSKGQRWFYSSIWTGLFA